MTKVKKMKDCWDTFRQSQRNHVDLHGAVLGNALNNKWWEGYVTALCEFGIIKEFDRDDMLAWRPV